MRVNAENFHIYLYKNQTNVSDNFLAKEFDTFHINSVNTLKICGFVITKCCTTRSWNFETFDEFL